MVKKFTKLTDSQWEVIKDLFPEQKICTHNLRTILNAIFFILRTGTQWRNLHEKYPPFGTVYHHFRKWNRDGRFEEMNELLIKKERKRQGKKKSPSLVCGDSQSVKSTSFTVQEVGFDGGKKIKGRKRHIITDSLGLIIGVVVSAANKYDGTIGIKLFGKMKPVLKDVKKVLVDGAYKGKFVNFITEHLNAETEISSRPPSSKGFVPVKIRWMVERTFGWFNFFRRLSKDYEKTVESSAAWILLTNCQIILQRLAKL